MYINSGVEGENLEKAEKDILKEIREEPQLYTLWRNYVAENKYAEGLEFHVILDIVDEIAEMLNF